MAAPLRIERLERQIVEKVGMVLRQEISDPRLGMVTITRARLARDLGHCEVLWSTLDEGKKRTLTEKALESARGYVQRAVAAELQLRTAPHIEFRFDKAFEADTRLQSLIGKAREADEAKKKPHAREGTDA